VELRFKDLATAQLTPFAAAGRLALEPGGELQRAVEAIDRSAAALLAQCASDAPLRAELESLRGDAIKAAALAGQLDHARAGVEKGESGEAETRGMEG
jgi:hypothetical protein